MSGNTASTTLQCHAQVISSITVAWSLRHKTTIFPPPLFSGVAPLVLVAALWTVEEIPYKSDLDADARVFSAYGVVQD